MTPPNTPRYPKEPEHIVLPVTSGSMGNLVNCVDCGVVMLADPIHIHNHVCSILPEDVTGEYVRSYREGVGDYSIWPNPIAKQRTRRKA